MSSALIKRAALFFAVSLALYVLALLFWHFLAVRSASTVAPDAGEPVLLTHTFIMIDWVALLWVLPLYFVLCVAVLGCGSWLVTRMRSGVR